MRISLKLAAGFGVMALLVGSVSYSSRWFQVEVERELEKLSRGAIVSVVDAANMREALSGSYAAAQEILLEMGPGNSENRADATSGRLARRPRDTIETYLDQFGRGLERCQTVHQSLVRETGDVVESGNSNGENLARLEKAYKEYLASMNQFMALVNEEPETAGTFFDDRIASHVREQMIPLIRSIQKDAEANFTRGVRSVQRATVRARSQGNLITLVSLAAALGLVLLVAWSIGRPLEKLTRATMQLSTGRLDTRIEVRSRDEVGTLARAFNQMASSLQATTVAKTYVDNIIGSIQEILIVTDRQLNVQRVNRAAVRELGFCEEEFTGRQLSQVLVDPVLSAHEDAAPPPPALEAREGFVQTKSGKRVPVWFTTAHLGDQDNSVQGIVCVATNISDRKVAEQRLRNSLREKEVLLKEVHHRVKNNLQIISSLLNLQARAAGDRAAEQALRDSQSRIHSMSLVHEQLYRSDNLASVDFAEYVRQLTAHLARSFGAAARAVAFHLDVESVALPVDSAIPCGMIVNELVVNAMEHAFPEGQSGEIRIGFHSRDGRRELVVCDDGVGFTPSEADPASGSLGLKVVQALVEQIGGEMQVERNGGTRYLIQFETHGVEHAAPPDGH